MNKKTTIWVGVGCGTGCLVLAIIVLITGAFVQWVLEEPENVDIETTVPINVVQGESFVVEVQIQNLADQSQVLDSIDIDPGYLAGVGIEKSDPAFIGLTQVPFTQEQSYEFQENIPPGESLTVQFFAVGLQPGDFSGEVDICINSGTACSTFVTRTVVEE